MAQRLNVVEVQVEAKIAMAISMDDIMETIPILEEAIESAEANNLLRVAARAHHNLSTYLFHDLNSALWHDLQAADITRKIGEIEFMMFILEQVAYYYVELGELNTVEDKLAVFLRTTSVPENIVNQLWLEVQRLLMIKRGEWKQALEATHKNVERFREKEHVGKFSIANEELAEIILEMNWFGKLEDLSQADSALRENLEVDFQAEYYYPHIAIVYARQGRIPDARELITKSLDKRGHDKNQLLYKVILSQVEFEIAYAEERWSEAVVACESSITILENSGQRWNLARKWIDVGDALMRRKESGDLERARETYQQSLDMFTEMGAPGYIKVLQERLGEL